METFREDKPLEHIQKEARKQMEKERNQVEADLEASSKHEPRSMVWD